jgi:hypothetical protein
LPILDRRLKVIGIRELAIGKEAVPRERGEHGFSAQRSDFYIASLSFWKFVCSTSGAHDASTEIHSGSDADCPKGDPGPDAIACRIS